MKKRIGILTGGGDCPGLNPAVRWFVEAAAAKGGWEVIGLRDGWKSLVMEDLVEKGIAAPGEDWYKRGCFARQLTPADVDGWERIGGTSLGSSRTNPYNPKKDRSAQVITNIGKLGLDALVAIGGEDTLGVARRLHAAGIPVVGIPKTIDADLPGTEYTLGFATAVEILCHEVDRLRTTAGSHSRFFVVEAMGRHAGHLALQGGMAAGADMILIPEVPFDIPRIVHLVNRIRDLGHRYGMIVVAEGAFPKGMDGPVSTGKALDPSFGHVNLGGVGEMLANAISAATDLGTRSVQLSHIQRGGAPVAYDRIMGMKFGFAASDLIAAGISGRMVAVVDGKVTAIGLEVLDEGLKLVDVEREYDAKLLNGKATRVLSVPGIGGAK
jgi:6-phosphofructokinase 1